MVLLICDLMVIIGITLLAVRTFKQRLSPARFCLITVVSYLVFFALSYVSAVIANVVLEAGWSVL